jgi:hypothetical protein
VTPPVTPRGRRGAASAAMWRRQPHHLPVGLQQGTCSFKRDFNTLLKFKRAFRVPRTQKGFSEGSLELNRGFRRILGTQQGFQKGSWNSTGVSEGSLELNRGFRRVVGTQQGFQKGPWNSTGVSEGWLEPTGGAAPPSVAGVSSSSPPAPVSRMRRWLCDEPGWSMSDFAATDFPLPV